MRCRSGAMIVGLILFMSACSAGAAPDSGPFYMVGEVYPAGEQTCVRLRKAWTQHALMDSRTDQQNYLCPVTFIPNNEGGGQVKLGVARRYINDEFRVDSRFVPIRGTSSCVQVREDRAAGRTTIFVDDGRVHEKGKIAELVTANADAAFSAWAVSRSGRYVLTVDPKEVTLWDATTRRVIERMTGGTLAELRQLLATKRGSTGQWWLSEDARFVFVEPTRDIVTATGLSGSGPMPVKLAGRDVDLQTEGILYDRRSRNFATFPSSLERAEVVDAEIVDRELRLVYLWKETWGYTVRLADGIGRQRAAHTLTSHVADVTYSGWDPASGTVWFHVRNARPVALESEEPNADNFLVRWDSAKDQEKWFRLTAAQIRDECSQRAEHMGALRCLQYSGLWETYWESKWAA